MTQLLESSVKPLQAKSKKILEGEFAVLGEMNRNRRIYPDEIYESAYQELIPKIQNRTLLGECDHPIDYDEIRLSNVSHVITECEIKERHGKRVVEGCVELLDTPSGKIAQALVEAGVPIGISSRGVGDVKRIPEGEEVTSLKLITYDLVAEPSFASAMLSEQKAVGLEESLKDIENKLPLNESLRTGDSSRELIRKIRESLVAKTNDPGSRVSYIDVQGMEVKTLQNMVESKTHLLERRTRSLKESTSQLRESQRENADLRQKLEESVSTNKQLSLNMSKLQDAYNAAKENTVSLKEHKATEHQLIEVRKQLAVEKRGMTYSQVGRMLEGLTTEKEIEEKLDSLQSLSRRNYDIEQEAFSQLKESKAPSKRASSSSLSSIISKV